MLLLAASAQAGQPFFLLPEPSFMARKGTQPIPDAKSTVLAPAQIGEFGLEFPTAEQWAAAGVSEADLTASTRAAASDWLKQLKVEPVRGPNKVVEYVKLSSTKVPACGAVLAPEFAQQFEEVLGPKPLVVMPNRSTVYVFPALAGKHAQYSAMILTAWHSREPRVSLEVFELTAKGLRAVGTFEE